MLARFLFIAVANISALEVVAAEPPNPPAKITRITLTRSGNGHDSGPEDTLTLRADGTAAYLGQRNVERNGSFKGKIPRDSLEPSFPLLARMYESLRAQPPSTGKPTEGLTAVTLRVERDGKAEEITDLCPGMDLRLRGFEMAVRGAAADVAWQRESGVKTDVLEPQRNRAMDQAAPPIQDLIAWGTSVNGLQTGLGFAENTKNGKHVVEMGKPIGLVVKLRNAGKTEINGSYSEGTFYDQPPTVWDEAGNRLEVVPAPIRLGLWRLVSYTLKPGEERTISSPQIVFVSNAPSGAVSIATVKAAPGKYKISFAETGKVDVEIVPAR